nr:DUF4890 domain-containing protein [Bacteroides salyersiae]
MGKKPPDDKEEREKMRAGMKTVNDGYNVQLQKIMTKEQYVSYTKKRSESEQRMKKYRREGESTFNSEHLCISVSFCSFVIEIKERINYEETYIPACLLLFACYYRLWWKQESRRKILAGYAG